MGAMEDSHRRVRAAILRRGGAQETEYTDLETWYRF